MCIGINFFSYFRYFDLTLNKSDIKQNDQSKSINNDFWQKKRMTISWDYILKIIADNSIEKEYLENISEISLNLYFPKKEDLNGAALALIRLQRTYKLNPSDLANGQIKGVQYK